MLKVPERKRHYKKPGVFQFAVSADSYHQGFKNLGLHQIPTFCDLAKAWEMGEEDTGHLVGNKEAGNTIELCIYCRPGRLNLILEKY